MSAQYSIGANTSGYFVVHGHFYQPPRENPFTGAIPSEFGASPYHNFNQMITEQSYKPLAYAGAFEYISFNLGPTLVSYLETYHPDVLYTIIQAEKKHRERFGTSNALAQSYNHTILPLSLSNGNYRDLWLQVKWGIASYTKLFGHTPVGMWLPETAVCIATLQVLAWCGIEYTIVAKNQIQGDIDTRRPCNITLPGNESITVFVRNDDLTGTITDSQSGATVNAVDFAYYNLPRNTDTFAPLTLIACDGESFGHHVKGGDRFLSYLLKESAPHRGFAVVDLEYFLKTHPEIVQEAEIHPFSSWSCLCGGLKRWKTGCECPDSGGYDTWKTTLRTAIHNLNTWAYELYEIEVRNVLPQPHFAREDDLSLRDGSISSDEFWSRHGRGNTKPDDSTKIYSAFLLLEAQYYLQQAYTSCAWYWDSFERPEVHIVLNAARRAIQLITLAVGVDYEPFFKEDVGIYPRDLGVSLGGTSCAFEDHLAKEYGTPVVDSLYQAKKKHAYTELAKAQKTRSIERFQFNIQGHHNNSFVTSIHTVLDEAAKYDHGAYLDALYHLQQAVFEADLQSIDDNRPLWGRSDGRFSLDGSNPEEGGTNDYKHLRFVFWHECGHNRRPRGERFADEYANEVLEHVQLIQWDRYIREVPSQHIDFETWKQNELRIAGGRLSTLAN